jgi:hypothetical protein
MRSLNLKSFVLLAVVFVKLAAISCLPPKGINANSDRTSKKQGASGTSGGPGTIMLQFPALSNLTTGVSTNLNSNSNSYLTMSTVIQTIIISVSPVDKNCKGATKVSESIIYSNELISKKLNPNCDYHARIALGGKTALGSDAVYYSMKNAEQIESSELQSGSVKLYLTLEASGSAKAQGLPATIATVEPGSDTSPETSPNIYPSPTFQPTGTPQPTSTPTPTPNPNPNPNPNNGLSPLPSNLAKLSLQGAQTAITLGSYWTTKYLYVEFSRPGCGPCVDMAGSLSGEESRFGGRGDCKALVVVPNQQLSSWHSAIGGAQTFAGRSSFAFSGSHDGFASYFEGIGTIESTPTIALIDRSGKAVGLDVGQSPALANQLCR